MQFNSSEIKQGSIVAIDDYVSVVGAENTSGNSATIKVNSNGEVLTAHGSTIVTKKPWMAAVADGDITGAKRITMYKFAFQRYSDIAAQTRLTRSITREANQVSIKSSSSNDTYGTGTGYQQVRLYYVDTNGDHQEELININGTTAVNSVATDIYYLYEAMIVSDGGGSHGTVTVYSNINGAGNNSYDLDHWEDEYGPSHSGLFYTGNKTLYITDVYTSPESDLDTNSNAGIGMSLAIRPHPLETVSDNGYALRYLTDGTRRVIHMSGTAQHGVNLLRKDLIIVPPEHDIYLQSDVNSCYGSWEGWIE
jgi:hypothetical protein